MLKTMDSYQEYKEKEARVVEQLKAINLQGASVAIAKSTSNLFRARKLASGPRLDFTTLNQVIQIDPKKRIAEVEAATTYKDLVSAALAHDLMPAVVPQFTTITLGGAVAGGACESSSYQYGTVHETVLEMTVLLSDGQIVTATPTNKYKDLFFALPNTFGSLGYILKLKIMLVPVKPFVRLRHVHFTNANHYFKVIQEIMDTHRYKDTSIDFVDGMVLAGNDLYLTLGQFVDSAPYTSDYTYRHIYYKSIPQRDEDYLTVHDYIWRWETDWVWGSKAFGMQNRLLRVLLGKVMLNSPAYWRLLNLDRRYKIMDKVKKMRPSLPPKEIMVQDVETPIQTSQDFLDYFLATYDLRPIWVCPMKSYDDQTFTFSGLKPNVQYVNFGLWGSVTSDRTRSSSYFNRLLEKAMPQFKGSKALYSTNFYPEKEFWHIFNQAKYAKLKAKYDPKGRLKSFYQKVCKGFE